MQLQESITTWPSLVPCGDLAGKPSIPLGLAVVLIGSRQSANVRINSTRVSRAHALVISSDKRVVIRDLASRTGTTVNGRRIREAELQPGDQVGIGPFMFEFAPGLAMPPLAERQVLPPAQLEVLGGVVQHTGQRITLIGKRSDSDVLLHDEQVSTAHAALFDMDGRRYIRDLGSRLGTYVNGQAVNGIEIRLGDEIRIGSAVLRYLAAPPRVPGSLLGGAARISALEARIDTRNEVEDEARVLQEAAPVSPLPEPAADVDESDTNRSNGHSGDGNGADLHAMELLPAAAEDEVEAHDERGDDQVLGEVSIGRDEAIDTRPAHELILEEPPPLEAAVTDSVASTAAATATATAATVSLPVDVLEELARAAAPPIEPAPQPVASAVVESIAEVPAELVVEAAEAESETVVAHEPVAQEPVAQAPVAEDRRVAQELLAPEPREEGSVQGAPPAAVPEARPPVATPAKTLEFDCLEDWAAISPMLQANLVVLPVPVSGGATLIPMPDPAVQWPGVVVSGMTALLSGWDQEQPAAPGGAATGAPAAEKVAEETRAASAQEPEIGEIEVIWTSAPSMSASMTVDLVWDEPQVAAPRMAAPLAAPLPALRENVGVGHPMPHRATDAADASDALPEGSSLEAAESVVSETVIASEKPSAPEPQTVGWTGQGNPEGWGPLAAAVTVAPVIGTATPNSTLTGSQSVPRRPLLQIDASAKPAPRSNYPYAFETPLDLTPLWAVLGVLGVAGFAALLWFVVIPAMLPKGHPTPSNSAVPALNSNQPGADAGKGSDRTDTRGNAAPAPQRPRPSTGTPVRPASRPAGWLE